MKPRILSSARLSFPLASAIAALLAAPLAQAATLYWDVDGSATSGFGTVVGTWNTTNNFWNTDSAGSTGGSVSNTTTAADDLIIMPASINTGAIAVTGTQNASSITFAPNVGPTATITGGAIIIGGTGTSSGIFQQSSGANTISTALTLNSTKTAFNFSNSSTGLLTIGAVTGAATTNTTQTITVGSSSTGDIALGGIIGNGGSGGNVALTINSTGAGITTLNGANTFTGPLTIARGTLSTGTFANISASSVILGGSGTTGTLKYTGGNISSTKPITFAAGGTGIIDVTGAATVLTLDSAGGGLSGSGNFEKTGAGTLALYTKGLDCLCFLLVMRVSALDCPFLLKGDMII